MSIIKANYANLQNAVGELQICAKELEKYGADIKHIQKQIAKATFMVAFTLHYEYLQDNTLFRSLIFNQLIYLDFKIPT